MQRKICIAPMMGWTDRHARFFLRQITRGAVLFSEMQTPEAIVRGPLESYLGYHDQEHPVAFQLGGNQPEMLAQAARLVGEQGYDEVNFNVGCPNPGGMVRPYGAYLMNDAGLVARCVMAMQNAVSVPVTVKTRIGIDRDDRYEPLAEFVKVVSDAGCRTFFVHARKAWLDGLSPQENREIPPLRYDYVYRLKREFPELTIVLNGGITQWHEASLHLLEVDGVMVGRRAYLDPYWLATVDRDFFGSSEPVLSRAQILRRCIPYVEAELAAGTGLRHIVRHMGHLFRDVRGGKAFRRQLSIESKQAGAGNLDTFKRAIDIADTLSDLMDVVHGF